MDTNIDIATVEEDITTTTTAMTIYELRESIARDPHMNIEEVDVTFPDDDYGDGDEYDEGISVAEIFDHTSSVAFATYSFDEDGVIEAIGAIRTIRGMERAIKWLREQVKI